MNHLKPELLSQRDILGRLSQPNANLNVPSHQSIHTFEVLNKSRLHFKRGHRGSPPVLLNPMSWPPLRRVLVSDDELSESDEESSDRFRPSAL